MDAVEFCESSTTTLEWTVKSLKNLFDSSKGDLKSKVCKSVKFGGGCVAMLSLPLWSNEVALARRWQVLFYPNRYDDPSVLFACATILPPSPAGTRAVLYLSTSPASPQRKRKSVLWTGSELKGFHPGFGWLTTKFRWVREGLFKFSFELRK